MLQMVVELKREGTLIFLYINGKTRQCWMPDRWYNAVEAYEKEVNERYEAENRQRKLIGRDPVTRESFDRWCSRAHAFYRREPVNAVLQ